MNQVRFVKRVLSSRSISAGQFTSVFSTVANEQWRVPIYIWNVVWCGEAVESGVGVTECSFTIEMTLGSMMQAPASLSGSNPNFKGYFNTNGGPLDMPVYSIMGNGDSLVVNGAATIPAALANACACTVFGFVVYSIVDKEFEEALLSGRIKASL